MASDVEWLDTEPAPAPRRAPPGGPRRIWPLIAAVAVAAAITIALVNRPGSQHGRVLARIPYHPAPQAVPTLVLAGHPLLGITDPYPLYARGPAGITRIEAARGVARTVALPALQSDGPVTFLAAAGAVIVRPIDIVPGYLVADDGTVRELTGLLAADGAVPGPRPGQLWVEDGEHRMTLVDLADRRLESVQLPADTSGPPRPDGSGYLLVLTDRGVLDLRPGGSQVVVSTGFPLAIGANRFLVAGCYGPACPIYVVSAIDGTRRRLGTLAVDESWPQGVISPDGRTAAIYLMEPAGVLTVRLVDLRTGAVRDLYLQVDPGAGDGTLVFSPDGRWLFAVTAGNTLAAVDVRDATVHDLGIALPPVFQLAVTS